MPPGGALSTDSASARVKPVNRELGMTGSFCPHLYLSPGYKLTEWDVSAFLFPCFLFSDLSLNLHKLNAVSLRLL